MVIWPMTARPVAIANGVADAVSAQVLTLPIAADRVY
jgi:hypothetical protein